MKKMFCQFAALFVFSSCTTFQNLLNPDYSVHYELSEEQAVAVAAKVEAEKGYLKKFFAKDSMGKLHVRGNFGLKSGSYGSYYFCPGTVF